MEHDIPLMAKGTFIPPSVYEKMRLEEENKQLREELKRIADSASVQADLAVKQSKKADVKGWIAIFISAFCAFIEFAIHYEEILLFVKNLL